MRKLLLWVKPPTTPAWFNSAKFLNLEYQTYGTVSAKIKEEEAFFHWHHATKDIAFTAVYNNASKEFIGVNVFGLKLRHEYLDKWLQDKVSIEYVLSNLPVAFFDKEFSGSYATDIIASYNKQTSSAVQMAVKKKSFSFLNFK